MALSEAPPAILRWTLDTRKSRERVAGSSNTYAAIVDIATGFGPQQFKRTAGTDVYLDRAFALFPFQLKTTLSIGSYSR
jgi:hypothetical protein